MEQEKWTSSTKKRDWPMRLAAERTWRKHWAMFLAGETWMLETWLLPYFKAALGDKYKEGGEFATLQCLRAAAQTFTNHCHMPLHHARLPNRELPRSPLRRDGTSPDERAGMRVQSWHDRAAILFSEMRIARSSIY